MPEAPVAIDTTFYRRGIVWAGDRLVAWGKVADGTSAAGSAYLPITDEWELLPESPLAPRTGHAAVWTGEEVIFWGGASGEVYEPVRHSDGAAYNTKTGKWRSMSSAPIAANRPQAVWTGREMIVWGASLPSVDSAILSPEAAAYDPAADSWRLLPAVPHPWSGDDGPAVTAAHEGDMLVWRGTSLGIYDPETSVWKTVDPPALPDSGCSTSLGPVSAGAMTTSGLLIWTGGCDATTGLLYEPDRDRWTRVADSEFYDRDPFVVASRHGIFASTRRSDGSSLPRFLHFALASERWTEIAFPPVTFGYAPFLAWTGDSLIVYGGYDEHGRALKVSAIFRPG